MIRNQWYVLLESSEVRQKPVSVIRMGERMVFWRDSRGKAHCAIDQCPHRGAQLGQGAVVDDHLQCPFHGFEFDASGACVHIPANGRSGVIPSTVRLHTYPVHEERGFLWVWWGKNPPTDLEPPAFFDNIDDSFYHASAQDPWDAHYSRAIENQLDVVHLPFVHRKTIGRGGRTLVDGPLIEWRGDKMLYTYVFNRADDGTPPRKPSQLSVREATSVHLEFILPNLWQNYISDDTRIVIAFVPVDDTHSILYIRFYQRFLPLPILGELAAKLAMPMNLYIAHEDRRVVVTQQPKVSGLKIGEALIQGDLPIIEYRRKREELQNT
jgi:phenylpropionate dioxygenase-like ring-hydroxylating dioxygenase large terminal subunit